MIDLYLAGTGNGLRASVALEEAGLPYRAHKIDLANGEQRSPAFLKINPAGLIPAIVDPSGPNGMPLTLTQSGAIVLYAAEKGGRLMPADGAARALALQWFMQAATDIATASGTIFQLDLRAPDKSAANVTYFKTRLLNFFALVDQHLAGREYLSSEFSVADVMLYPNFALRKSLVDEAGGFAHLQRWGAAIAARPAVQRGMKAAG